MYRRLAVVVFVSLVIGVILAKGYRAIQDYKDLNACKSDCSERDGWVEMTVYQFYEVEPSHVFHRPEAVLRDDICYCTNLWGVQVRETPL